MKKLIFSCIFFLSISTCFSQKYDKNVRVILDERGIIECAIFRNVDDTTKIPKSASVFFKEFLEIEQNDKFILDPKVSKQIGLRHEHYDQYYSNIKIEGAGYNFHFKNERLSYAHGYYVKVDNLNTVPSITPDQAIQLFANYKDIPISSITKSSADLFIKEIRSTNNIIKPFLIYKVYIQSDQVYNDEYGIIDSHTGEVLSTESFVACSSATGTFATRYNGTKQGITDYYGGKYHLADFTRNATIHTYNLQGNTNWNNAVDLNDNDNNWTTAEHSPNENDMALDVHWGVQQIYDYMYNTYGYNSYNNAGYPINSYIRFGTSYYDRNISAYDMDVNKMRFGDGISVFRPLSSLDIVAHEYGHGITDFQIGWAYSDTPWPLKVFHEGLSDIWAIIMDNRLTNQQAWKIGEQVDIQYGCWRNIQDPNGPYNNARWDIADTYMSDLYNGTSDPHIKGGVFSYMFYLLVNGSGGFKTNDLGHTYIVQGIGMDLAEEIIVQTVYNGYLNGVYSWQGIRESMVQATYDEILECNENYSSTIINQIENAWYAVGVGLEPNQMYIDGPWLLCFSSQSFTIQDLIPSATITWSCSSNITRISTQGSNPCYFQANSSGSGWIKASINAQCDNMDIVYNIWAGKFEYTVVTGTAAVCPDTWYRYEAQVPGGHDPSYSYSWTYPSGWYLYNYGQNTIDLIPPSYPTGGSIQVSITNSCGTSGYSGMYVWPDMSCYGGYYYLYPNPATDEVTIAIYETESPAIEENDISGVIVSKAIPSDQVTYTIRIYNSMGTLVSTATRTGTSFNIPLSNLRDGTYIVELNDGNNSYREQLIIKHY